LGSCSVLPIQTESGLKRGGGGEEEEEAYFSFI